MMNDTVPARKGNIKLPAKPVIEAHLRAGMTVAAIAERYSASKETVRNRVRDLGLAHLVANRTPKRAELDHAAVVADRKAGLSFFAIDKKHGLSMGTAKRVALAAGLAVGFDAVKFRPEKTVIGKRVAAGEYGGAAYLKISLPLISMHVRYLQEGAAPRHG